MYARLLRRGSHNVARSATRPAVGAAGFTSVGKGASPLASASQKALLHNRHNAGIGRAAVSFRRQPRRVSNETGPEHLDFFQGYTTRRHPKACSLSREGSLSSPLGAVRPLSSTSQEGKGQEDGEIGKAGGAEGAQKAGDGEAQDEEVDEVVALREELAKVDGQLKDTREKALYLAAEMENVRAIAKRDADSARLYAVQKFAKQLLDVADNLERAVTSGEGAEGSGGDSAHDQLLLGVKMTSEELQKVFRNQGLVKYGETGDKFDPHLHDAMFEYVDADQTPGRVGQVGTVKAP